MRDIQFLIDYYIEEYEGLDKKRRTIPLRSGLEWNRIQQLYRTMRRNRNAVSSISLEEYRRQIRNIYIIVKRREKKQELNLIQTALIPELVRLDLLLLLPEERASLNTGYVDYAKQEFIGEICSRPLYELFRIYWKKIIQKKILGLVPARPELEFPEAVQMHRKFFLHIGPTNSGKTFRALERLKGAKHGVYLGPLRLLALEVYEKMQSYGVPCTMLTGQECIMDKGSHITASTIEMADLD